MSRISSGARALRRWMPGAALLLAITPVSSAEFATQKSSQQGVTVAVTPVNLTPSPPSWDFKIVLDTHSAELNDDLPKNVVLVDGTGGEHAPIAWNGAGPGGHHREGVLSFKPLGGDVDSIELRIQRPGEPSPRSFRWQLR